MTLGNGLANRWTGAGGALRVLLAVILLASQTLSTAHAYDDRGDLDNHDYTACAVCHLADRDDVHDVPQGGAAAAPAAPLGFAVRPLAESAAGVVDAPHRARGPPAV